LEEPRARDATVLEQLRYTAAASCHTGSAMASARLRFANRRHPHLALARPRSHSLATVPNVSRLLTSNHSAVLSGRHDVHRTREATPPARLITRPGPADAAFCRCCGGQERTHRSCADRRNSFMETSCDRCMSRSGVERVPPAPSVLTAHFLRDNGLDSFNETVRLKTSSPGLDSVSTAK
jgi:hypothetical protein